MALCLSLLLASLCVACGEKKDTADNVGELIGAEYPLKTDVTLTYWMVLSEDASASVTDFSQTRYAQAAEDKTGVKIEYIHQSTGRQTEQFNLMLASGDLPDIIETGWYEFSGGPSKAIADGYIIELNDYMSNYAPNISKYLKKNPEIDKAGRTDEGKYYMFPFIRGNEKLLVSTGPIVRQDLLEKYSIETPVTFDDWYKMLKIFKQEGVEIPLAFNATSTWEIEQLVGVFGASKGFYRDGEEIKFGPFDPEFKQTLQMLAKWYKEGLLDKNFTTTDSKIKESNVLNGKVGITYGSGGGNLGKWIGSLPEKSEIKLGTVPFPKWSVDDEGSKFRPIATEFSGIGAAVSTSCKNPELAIKYLDYFYGEEGHMISNFGILNESYEMIDGKPIYKDIILDNPDGLSVSQSMALYLRAYLTGPFVQDKGYIEQYYALSEQKKALRDWSQGAAITQKHLVPKILCTSEEAQEMAGISNNVNTYVDTMIIKYITGIESFDNWDDFVGQLKKYNVERAIEIQQSAYERFKNR